MHLIPYHHRTAPPACPAGFVSFGHWMTVKDILLHDFISHASHSPRLDCFPFSRLPCSLPPTFLRQFTPPRNPSLPVEKLDPGSSCAMTSPISNHPIPSELDDEVDDADLPPGLIWVYPCKLPSCPDHGQAWKLRSNFLSHLNECEAHSAILTTTAARPAIEIDWRYATDPDLPPRVAPHFRPREDPEEVMWNYSFKDDLGRVVSGRGTVEQVELHKAQGRQQTDKTQNVCLRSCLIRDDDERLFCAVEGCMRCRRRKVRKDDLTTSFTLGTVV